MGILKSIEWKDDNKSTLVYRLRLDKDYITNGSKLTVREGQAAVFCDKGKMADVFEPGFYTLDTNNVPVLTKLMSWKYGFESPFKSDIYFVSTRQFTALKWGTQNPIVIRDKDFGMVRIRAFGTYAFKIEDPYIFLTEMSGALSSFSTSDITEWIRSTVITRICDIVGQCKIPVLDMAGNLVEFGDMVKKELQPYFSKIGLQITGFNFENFSLPENVEKALDESTSLGILGKNMGIYTQKAQADALRDAARNPGMAGGTMGAGIGMGMGMNMANMFNNNFNNGNNSAGNGTVSCPNCGKSLSADSKFCSNCGQKIQSVCSKCGAKVAPDAKFCPECGGKI